MEIEVWKDIKDYEGLYQVSNIGRVRSLDRNIKMDGWIYPAKGKMLKPIFATHGYRRVDLSENGISKQNLIHRLVATAFIPNPDNKPQVNHINGIKDDNRVKNIEWVTPRENAQHSWDTGLSNKDSLYKAVLMLNLENEPLLIFDSGIEAASMTGISNQCISQCCNGKTKTSGGYKWRFVL